ncbi:MAG: HNH endonuclease [Bacillota bacterium]
MVTETFIPNPMENPQVNHKDGNKLNNYYLNLEWCSNKENALHAVQTGLINRLNKERVIEIYKAYWIDQIPIYKVAKKFKVTESIVSLIKYKNAYKDILSKVKISLVIEA